MDLQERKPYEAPKIILQNVIQTRAGSPLSDLDNADPFDPAELFSND